MTKPLLIKTIKRITLGLIGVGVLAAMFWYINTYIYQFYAFHSKVIVDMSSTPSQVQNGDNFNVSAIFSAQKLASADLILTFDKDKLDFQDTVTSVPSDYFRVEYQKVTDSAPNQCKLRVILVGQTTTISTPIQVNMGFKAINTGNATIRITDETVFAGVSTDNQAIIFENDLERAVKQIAIQGSAAPSNTPTVRPSVTLPPSGSPIPTSGSPTATPTTVPSPSGTEDLTPTIPLEQFESVLNMAVRFQGIPDIPREGYRTLNARVTLKNAGETVKEETVTFTAQPGGTWTGSFGVDGINTASKYEVIIKGAKHLAKKICDNNPSEQFGGTYRCRDANISLQKGENTINFSNIILLGGDLPAQDGIINALDFAFVRQNLGSQAPENLARGDINLDGIIDTQDHTIIKTALEFKYDEE